MEKLISHRELQDMIKDKGKRPFKTSAELAELAKRYPSTSHVMDFLMTLEKFTVNGLYSEPVQGTPINLRDMLSFLQSFTNILEEVKKDVGIDDILDDLEDLVLSFGSVYKAYFKKDDNKNG